MTWTTGGDMDFSMNQGDSAGRKRVLVVEDELMIRMLLQDMLDDLGHTLAGAAGRSCSPPVTPSAACPSPIAERRPCRSRSRPMRWPRRSKRRRRADGI